MDVNQTLYAGGFRRSVAADAVREIDEFCGELIPGWEPFGASMTMYREVLHQRSYVFERGVKLQATFGADELIGGHVSRAKTANKARELSIGKVQQRTRHFVYFLKATVRPLHRESADFGRILLK
jgi:hypothetical protein